MKDITWIDDLKLRGGWGQTGNQSGIGDYSYLQRYNINRIPWFEEGNDHAVPGISQANLRTSDLKWETTNQTNIGLDLTVLNNLQHGLLLQENHRHVDERKSACGCGSNHQHHP